VTRLTIAIAKGRLEQPALELLRRAEFCELREDYDSRRLAIEDETGCFRFIFVKPMDVPVYVERGVADCGVVGRDVLLEYEPDVLQPLTLDIGRCRFVVAAPLEMPPFGHRIVRVATKFPRVATSYFGARGQPVEIITLSGSVELAPGLGLADCIVDLVETGRTLRDNGLEAVEEIAELSARLIVNRASYQLKVKEVSRVIEALSQAVGGVAP